MTRHTTARRLVNVYIEGIALQAPSRPHAVTTSSELASLNVSSIINIIIKTNLHTRVGVQTHQSAPNNLNGEAGLFHLVVLIDAIPPPSFCLQILHIHPHNNLELTV